MIKVHKAMAEGFFHAEKTNRVSREPQESLSATDSVTISEEGKKKRVMGDVMASLSGAVPMRYKLETEEMVELKHVINNALIGQAVKVEFDTAQQAQSIRSRIIKLYNESQLMSGHQFGLRSTAHKTKSGKSFKWIVYFVKVTPDGVIHRSRKRILRAGASGKVI